MRPAKFYAARRPNRIIYQVNLPPKGQALPEPPRHSRRAVLWRFAKVAGPAIASAIAIVISVLAYTDQHSADEKQAQVDQAAAVAGQRAYATEVSYWLVPGGQGARPDLVIQNRSSAPVSHVAVMLQPEDDPDGVISEFPDGAHILASTRESPTFKQMYWYGIIPSCTVLTITRAIRRLYTFLVQSILYGAHLTKGAKREVTYDLHLTINVTSVKFVDGNGVSWQRNANESLDRAPPVQPLFGNDNPVGAGATLQTVSGCAS